MSALVALVVGGKGGAGASTVATELAGAARRAGRRVALVDGDLAARRSIAVLVDAVRALDAARVNGNLASIDSDGWTLAELTASIDGAFTLAPAHVEVLAEELVARHDLVVVDAPQPYAAVLRPFVFRAHDVLLVVEPSLLGVTGARSTQLELARFGVPPAHITTVVNARDARSAARRVDVEEALQCRVAVEFPAATDRRFSRAAEQLLGSLDRDRAPLGTLVGPSMRAPVGDRRAPQVNRAGAVAIAAPSGEAQRSSPASDAARDVLKAEIHAALAERLDAAVVARGVDDATRLSELRNEVSSVVGELLSQRDVGSAEDVARLRQEIIDEALGLGPLEELLHDPSVTEIMVNRSQRIYVERGGRVELTAKRFVNDRQIRLIIERIVAPLGRRIDESQPMVDARLPDGSRVNAIIEPLAIDGPVLTIRKFPARRMNSDDLVRLGSVTAELVEFLRAAVEARLNVLVSGGTGSGKTTLLNVLSSFLPASERIVTIEDAAELSLGQEHVVRLEARPANVQGAGEITIRDLVRNALRMRPDRIIVGECRGGEALDMLQAMNTGHDGSLTTVHANGPRDALSRVETLVMMAGFELPVRAIREQIAGAIDLIVHVGRLRDGSRKLLSLAEVVGLEGDVVTTQEIATYQQRGLDRDGAVAGSFVFTGVQPVCLRRFEELGVSYDVRRLAALPAAVNW